MKLYILFVHTPLGVLRVCANEEYIVGIDLETGGEQRTSPLLQRAKKQLLEYFEGARTQFTLPLQPTGTPFQQKVWAALCEVEYGNVKSYKDIAIAIGNPNASRAVGMANNKNPIMIVIPCHRIIGSNGAMVGYAGGVSLKETLLTIEGYM